VDWSIHCLAQQLSQVLSLPLRRLSALGMLSAALIHSCPRSWYLQSCISGWDELCCSHRCAVTYGCKPHDAILIERDIIRFAVPSAMYSQTCFCHYPGDQGFMLHTSYGCHKHILSFSLSYRLGLFWTTRCLSDSHCKKYWTITICQVDSLYHLQGLRWLCSE
jgi:hypothetical protein